MVISCSRLLVKRTLYSELPWRSAAGGEVVCELAEAAIDQSGLEHRHQAALLFPSGIMAIKSSRQAPIVRSVVSRVASALR